MTQKPVWDREVPWRLYPGKNLQVQKQEGENTRGTIFSLLFFLGFWKKNLFKIISKKCCKNSMEFQNPYIQFPLMLTSYTTKDIYQN